jgi:transcription termination/antitermination protein NusG
MRTLVAPDTRGRTEGGEALTAPRWHAVWTHSHAEQLVHDQLAARGFRPFVPQMDVWSRRRGARHRIRVPMFPGYLFLNGVLDKDAYVRVLGTRGLVRVLGDRWDCLAVIPDAEVEAIQRVSAVGEAVLPHPYLREGRRARIVHGPLAGLEGILTIDRSDRGLLVLSVELLRRSVAVTVDCMDVEPA